MDHQRGQSYEGVMKGQKYGLDWQPDVSTDRCMLCAMTFTLMKRRHHCRKCGLCVCDACSTAREKVFGSQNMKRVCADCADGSGAAPRSVASKTTAGSKRGKGPTRYDADGYPIKEPAGFGSDGRSRGDGGTTAAEVEPTPAEYEKAWGSPTAGTFNTIMKSEKYGVVWQQDADAARCAICERGFTWTMRRHHCRMCGGIVCATCSESRLLMEGSHNKKRSCDVCVQGLGLKGNHGRESW